MKSRPLFSPAILTATAATRCRFPTFRICAVWLMTTAGLTAQVSGHWNFDSGDLRATVGEPLEYFDGPAGETATKTLFGTTGAGAFAAVPHINGQPAKVMKVPGDLSRDIGYVLTHGIQPNGGGTRVNQYTLIMDVMVGTNGQGGTASLLQISSVNNTDDGDIFWRSDGNFGQGQFGYNGTGAWTAGRWHRVIMACDLAATVPVITKFVDGIKQDDWTTNQGLDQPRRALLPSVLLFADGDFDERREWWVNSLQIRAGKMSDQDAIALGGPTAAGIPRAGVDLATVVAAANVLTTENLERTLTLSVSNRGPSAATGVQFTIDSPAGLRVQAATNSAGTAQVQGASNVIVSVSTLAGNGAFTVDLTLRPNFLPSTSELTVSLGDLTAVVTSSELELNPTDNFLALPVTVRAQTDWGDARGGFPVTAAEDGPYHRYSTNAPWLGARWDNDGSGSHSLPADFDDTHGASDDEDGVVFPSSIAPGTTVSLVVTCSWVAGMLDAWADFDSNTNFTDMGEKIFNSVRLEPGPNTVMFTVPAGATIGQIATRWRVSLAGGLGFTGYGGPGEVEDHLMTIEAPPGVDLRVALPDAPIEAEIIGQPFRFTATATNFGPSVASNVSMVVTFQGPPVSQITVTSSNTACQVVDGEVRCALERLTPGQSAALDVTATPQAGGKLMLRARVDFAGVDLTPRDNVAQRLLGIVSNVRECACSCYSNSVPSPDPQLTSWYTNNSGRYARILPATNVAPIAIWPAGPEAEPPVPIVENLHADVQKIRYNDSFIYINAYGLASHVMGPWYCEPDKFPNWPGAQTSPFQIPRVPDPSGCTNTGFGAIGMWVNGTAIYNMLDSHVYTSATDTDTTSMDFGAWNRDAWFSEASTFDYAKFHTAIDQYQYHSHVGSALLRLQLEDNVTASTNEYGDITVTEATRRLHHSPILGWAWDGHPIYGPYGYSDPTNASSGVRRMVSGYVQRNGENGTTDLRTKYFFPTFFPLTGRTSLPTWARLASGHPSTGSGPRTDLASDITACNPIEFSLGRYAEDNAFLGHLINPVDDDWFRQGEDFDLDLHNGRCCVTPEYPNGTYAYFITLNETNGPAFPYIIGWEYCGKRLGGEDAIVVPTVTTYFSADEPRFTTGDVLEWFHEFLANRPLILRWDSQEGRNYRLYSTTDFRTRTPISPMLPSQGTTTTYTYDPGTAPPVQQFFWVELNDEGGGQRPAKK